MLPDRYPAPRANHAFSDRSKWDSWAQLSRAYMDEAIDDDDSIDGEAKAAHHTNLSSAVMNGAWVYQPELWAQVEGQTGHDVVAFLQIAESRLPINLQKYLHEGLTSSDLVEFSHHRAMADHATAMVSTFNDLISLVHNGRRSSPRAARTHGQVADVTTLGHQYRVWREVGDRLRADLYPGDENLMKSPGPSGDSPLVRYRGNRVARRLGLRQIPSTQIIPRDYQLEWASVYLRVANHVESLAMMVRLGSRTDVGELREGATARRAGSSAMPHKKNPIDSEKVCGLARIARGYFMSLAEVSALWEDRDLSHSSTERVAVVGLAQTVEHMIATMEKVMIGLVHNTGRMALNADALETRTNIMQVFAQRHFNLGPTEASELVKMGMVADNVFDDAEVMDTFDLTRQQFDQWWDACAAEHEKQIHG